MTTRAEREAAAALAAACVTIPPVGVFYLEDCEQGGGDVPPTHGQGWPR